ncbi:hypothetical protein SAMN02910436_02852 [Ruminococcaceae bacterium P7]|nr:hypothetical protein SAMN02910436_02852 [Ruminococcaceae bacterium P7]
MKTKAIPSILLAICLAVTSAFALTGCGKEKPAESSSEIEETTEAPKELTLPVSSDEALKMNYEDLYDTFRNAGFDNADYDGLGDLASSSDKLNETIKSVTVNGSESFKKGDKMMSDVKILISYHSVKTVYLPVDKYDLKEDKDAIYYEDAVTQFKKKGFTDVSTRMTEDASKEEGRVTDIVVNGESMITEYISSAPVDATIVIVYNTKAAKPTQKPTQAPEKQASKADTDSDSVTPSFKETMDSYEAFFDSYIEFMKKYKENPGDLTMISEYADYMSKYTDYMSKLTAIDTTTLSAADLAYYTEVHTKILKKMAGTGE